MADLTCFEELEEVLQAATTAVRGILSAFHQTVSVMLKLPETWIMPSFTALMQSQIADSSLWLGETACTDPFTFPYKTLSHINRRLEMISSVDVTNERETEPKNSLRWHISSVKSVCVFECVRLELCAVQDCAELRRMLDSCGGTGCVWIFTT